MKKELRINIIYLPEKISGEIETSVATTEPPLKLSILMKILEENDNDDSQIIIPKGKYFVVIMRSNENLILGEDPELEDKDTVVIQKRKANVAVIEQNNEK